MANDLKYLDVAERVLAKHGRPLRSRDLVSLGIEDGFVESWDSKTPQKSMQARLSIDILRKGEESRFIRTKRGRFYLRGLLSAPLSRHHDLFSITEESPNYAQPFTTNRRIYPTPLENVLTVSQGHYRKFLDFQGLHYLAPKRLYQLINPNSTSYVSRIYAETIDDRKQVLTYIIVTHRKKVLSFRRGSYSNIAAFLRGSRCIGFGGHVTEHDHNLFSHDDLGVASSALRELIEEIQPSGDSSSLERRKIYDGNLIYRGILNDDSSDVGRRHVAVVYEYAVKDWSVWSKPQRGEKSVNQLEWIDTRNDSVDLNEFEYWSQLCWRAFFPPIVEAQPSYRILRKRPFKGPHLLVIAGTIGSGKSAATEFFCHMLQYREINSGKVPAPLLGLPPIPRTSRRRFQSAAIKFINSRNGPRRLAREICKIANSDKGRRIHVTTSVADMSYGSQTQVIKFHGDLNSPNEMVLSESHYEQRMRLESAMDLKLRSDILGRAILFVGYSFRDPNIAYLFRTVNEKFSTLPHSFAGKRAYIVVTNPSDFELQLFQERKIEVIPTEDLDRTRAISNLLAELAS
jgi:predicted NUDIX family phosphoesterase